MSLALASLLVLVPLVVAIASWWHRGEDALGEDTLPLGNFGYQIVKAYPHDRTAFTQGLAWHDGYLYETTGRFGESRLRKVNLVTGKSVQEQRLADDLFGEGMTLLNDRIYQLTYKAGIGIVYDAKTFAELRRFRYSGEGWGLTHDGKRLIMSNGSATLTFLDPATLEPTGTILVRYQDRPIPRLNELEYVRGEIFANVWTADTIVRIDPESGNVRGFIRLADLRRQGGITGAVDVLNGIAYDPKKRRLFVTGKWWSKLFEIRLIPEKN